MAPVSASRPSPRTMSLFTIFVPLLCLAHPILASFDCHPEGPIVPRPTQIWESPVFQSALANLTDALDAALAGTLDAGFDVENSSFTLAVVARDQAEPGTPAWEYDHLSGRNVNGKGAIGGDSQWMIGSVSKVFTDLVLMRSGVDQDVAVTEFLPVLKRGGAVGVDRVRWEDVTLRMLSMHLAGAPMNYGFSEFYVIQDWALQMGLPPISNSSYPPCGTIGMNGECSKQQFLEQMANVYPVTAPNERPAYSNIAFSLIAYAIEEATGKNYSQQIRDYIAEPLGLTSTFPSPGDDAKAVIPPVETSWGLDYGFSAPGGGLVSTPHDLSILAHAILARTFLSPAETLAWLKPTSFAGSPYSFVGQPWEIFRPPNITPDHPHSVTINSKAGGAFGYRTMLSLLDEYGVGIVVLTAGSQGALPYLYDAMLATVVPAVDAVARDQARAYTGVFSTPGCSAATAGGNTTRPSNSSPNSTSSSTPEAQNCTTATITQTADSLTITALTHNGANMLTAMLTLNYLALRTFVFGFEPTVRLFPTDLVESMVLGDGRRATRETWRAWVYNTDGPGSELPGGGGGGIWGRDCRAWTAGDWVHYGGEPLDRWVFTRDGRGEVVGLEVPFLRAGVMEHVSLGVHGGEAGEAADGVSNEEDREAEGEGW